MNFETGQFYETRSTCDWDTMLVYECTSRTAKTVTFLSVLSETPKRVKVRTYARGEWAMPEGQYSMAPVLRADRIKEAKVYQ